MAKFIAVVRKKTTFRKGALNSAAKPLLEDENGKELEADPDKPGKYLGTGRQRIESTATEAIDDPLTDEAGNPVEAGTVDALLRKVKEHFDGEDNVEVLTVSVQEVKVIQQISGEDLKKV